MGKLSDEQKIQLVKDYMGSKITTRELAKKYGITQGSAWTLLKNREVPRRKSKYDGLEEQIIDSYINKNMSVDDIAREYNGKRNGVYGILKRYGIKRKGQTERVQKTKRIKKIKNRSRTRRKYPVNEDFFDEINSEETAYFLGLIYADGYNSYKEGGIGEVGISLQEQDREILEVFNNFVQPTKKLYRKDSAFKAGEGGIHYCVRISSKYMCKQLIKLGCPPRKSLILKFPDFIPDELMNHFIRGYFDGDGCICKDKKRGYYTVSIAGTHDFCDGIKNYIKNNPNISSNKLHKNGKIKILALTSVDRVNKFADWLYKDATIYMKRKYDKFQEFKAEKVIGKKYKKTDE